MTLSLKLHFNSVFLETAFSLTDVDSGVASNVVSVLCSTAHSLCLSSPRPADNTTNGRRQVTSPDHCLPSSTSGKGKYSLLMQCLHSMYNCLVLKILFTLCTWQTCSFTFRKPSRYCHLNKWLNSYSFVVATPVQQVISLSIWEYEADFVYVKDY